MSRNIVVVESPAKARTIEKYLGKDFRVLASYGHVRDLVPKEGAVDPEHGFAMKYELIEKNEKHVRAIEKALKNADALYLATDPDREGEAISWHLSELLREYGALDDKPVHRVAFYEITKRAIQEAIENPRTLAMELVNAQQARRALDYLVGFKLSPLLWKKIRPGLSAGRVQSPALRMIVEREAEIEAFKPREYWTIEARLARDDSRFGARLAEYRGAKVEQFSFENEAAASEARTSLLVAAGGNPQTVAPPAGGRLRVGAIERKQRKRNPAAPFTTSTLQQEASRKLGFSAKKTMMVAQRLYEGVETSEGSVGLITYMRTDSVNLAAEAVTELRDFIAGRYGAENLPDSPRSYKTKAKNAQEAHEGIRPTSVLRTPDDMKACLDADQLKLYSLIWKRTVACQMVHAVFDMVALDLHPVADPAVGRFRATGSTLVKPGFIAVYQEGQDDVKDDEATKALPQVEQGDLLDMEALNADQHFTEPPPRYTEASLVKALEEYGIGRPSTYASIISTLLDRYCDLDSKRFIPQDIARLVIDFLTDHFTRYVDYDFTAHLEDELDEISRGERDWVPVLEEFWLPFEKLIREKESSVSRDDYARVLGTDPKSGKPVSVRMGRYGPFVQIGTRDDDEKPKFAGLRPGQKMATITLPEALELFKLPRQLGETPEGEPVSANIGRFGPYVKYGDKFASIRNDDPYTITLERALEVVREKKEADANRLIQDFPDDGIQVLNGRYGPYVTDRQKNARVPKDRDPKSLSLAECRELLANAPVRGRRGKAGKKKAPVKKTTAKKKASKKPAAKKKAASRKKTSRKKKAVRKKAAAKSAQVTAAAAPAPGESSG